MDNKCTAEVPSNCQLNKDTTDFSTNEFMAGLFQEFKLLGTDKPNNNSTVNKANSADAKKRAAD